MHPGSCIGAVYLCREPVDFRKSIGGLSALVEQELQMNPLGDGKAPVSTVLQTGREPIAVATHSLNIVSIKKSWAQY